VAEVAATPVERLLGRYRGYLTGERGLGAATARGYVDLVRPFVAGQATADGVDLEHLSTARRAGLGPLTAHRLRHTAATSMLRAGAGLAEIGQVLRHRRPLTTAVYAKVDRDALRTLARPWPTGAA
jgi:integrase/recombinase XerD